MYPINTSDVLSRVIEMPTGEERVVKHAFEWTEVTNIQEDLHKPDRTMLFFRGGSHILVEGGMEKHFNTWRGQKEKLQEIERFGNY